MNNHRHHRRNTEEYIQEMQDLDEKDHIEKDPDINLDSILSSRSKSALNRVFGIQKSENDLQKGSLQRKLPFNPKAPENQDVTAKQREWTHDEDQETRDSIPKMEGSPRVRALNKLAAKTHVRKHPETGERLFLMHRGMGSEEFTGANKDGKTTHETGTKTSWTPDKEVSDSFAAQGYPNKGYELSTDRAGGTVSAWIPESAIVHSVNQFNAPGTMDRKNILTGESIKHPTSRSVTEREENEWIVHHTQPFHHANLDALSDINSKINNKVTNIKPTPEVQSASIKKALEAGSGNVAPSNLSGGAALQSEFLSVDMPTFKPKKKKYKKDEEFITDLKKPFKSKKQRRFLYANPEKVGGKEALKEWESKTPKNIPESVKKKDKIPGGLADQKKPSDFDKKKLKQGIKVESEHTSDKEIASEIAMDHLTEDKNYYKKLRTIEKSEFLRRGVLLASLGAGAQMLHNQNVEDAKPVRREIASEAVERPPTEPEKAYDAAQKDAFAIAAKHLPLSRNLARQTIKESPELSAAHGYVMHLSPSAYKEVVTNNPQIKHDVAAYHYDKLHELHGGDQSKIFEDYKNRAKNIQKSTTSEK